LSDAVRDNALLGLGTIAAAVAVAVALQWGVTALIARVPGIAGPVLVRHCRRASLLVVAAVTALVALRVLEELRWDLGAARHALALVIIGGVAWLLVGLVGAACELVAGRFDVGSTDNLRARRVHTQATILRRIAVVLIGIVAVAVALTTFPSVRTLGASLLASAGIAGIVLGFAAQQALGNLLAGIQIAITEPIRLDDVVVLEGEYGRIHEITFTYVVVSLWDERSLILPISYFTTTPFENWTRSRSQIVGAVHLHVDHCVPVDAVREELMRVLDASPLWDGREAAVQVVDTHPHTVELRVTLSARDAPRAWDLRCEVREALIAFLRENHPDALPRLRADLGAGSALATAR
jgi:small-conductance mechanosensitive channel